MHQPKRWLAGCWGFLNPTVCIRKIYMKKNIYFLLASIGSLHCPTFQRSGGSEGFVGSAVRNRTKLGVARAFGTKLSKLLRVWTDHHWTTPPVASYCHTYCTKPRQYRMQVNNTCSSWTTHGSSAVLSGTNRCGPKRVTQLPNPIAIDLLLPILIIWLDRSFHLAAYRLHGSGASLRRGGLRSRGSHTRQASVETSGMETSMRSKDGVPIWNGESASFQTYEEMALQWEQGIPWHKRYLCGPRLVSELTGSAKKHILGKRPDWLSFNGGVDRLLQHLRQALGRPQIAEMSDHLNRYFKATKRKKMESMNDYITRKIEAYTRARQALCRVERDHGGRRGDRATSYGNWQYGGQWDGWQDRAWESEGEGAEFEDAEERHDEPDGGRLGSEGPGEDGSQQRDGSESRQWSWWGSRGSYWSTSNQSTHEDESWTTQAKELLPDFLQGWYLLQDATLEADERNLVRGRASPDPDCPGETNFERSQEQAAPGEDVETILQVQLYHQGQVLGKRWQRKDWWQGSELFSLWRSTPHFRMPRSTGTKWNSTTGTPVRWSSTLHLLQWHQRWGDGLLWWWPTAKYSRGRSKWHGSDRRRCYEDIGFRLCLGKAGQHQWSKVRQQWHHRNWHFRETNIWIWKLIQRYMCVNSTGECLGRWATRRAEGACAGAWNWAIAAVGGHLAKLRCHHRLRSWCSSF